jgi:hypothetical protein
MPSQTTAGNTVLEPRAIKFSAFTVCPVINDGHLSLPFTPSALVEDHINQGLGNVDLAPKLTY